MKAGRGKNKGNAFERRICQKLSLWWSEGKREDIFWRSASSGGVATMRSKRGKTMAGQSGDISAIHESGMPLTRLCTVELKRGYKGASIADMCDRLELLSLLNGRSLFCNVNGKQRNPILHFGY